MSPLIPEPTVTAWSPLFELRAWRRELDRFAMDHAHDDAVQEAVARARQEVDGWIRDRQRR